MKLVTRAEWGARSPKYRNTGSMPGKCTGHWNGPELPDVDHSKCASLVRGIQNFHMDGRGWSDIAYNFIICQHGYVFEGRGLNVWNGANGTTTGNKSNHAIMWMAGGSNPFTKESQYAFVECVDYIAERTAAPANAAIGHRDHKSTECPGGERYNWIHAGMPISGRPSDPQEMPMFKEGTDYAALVERMYDKMAMRPVDSDAVRDSHAWNIAVNQGDAYVKLATALIYETNLREKNRHVAQQNAIEELRAKVENRDPETQPVMTDEELLAKVWADLKERIS